MTETRPHRCGQYSSYSYRAHSRSMERFDAYIFFPGLAKFNSTFAQQGTWEYTIPALLSYHKMPDKERWENGDKITYPALQQEQRPTYANSFFVFRPRPVPSKNLIWLYVPANSLKMLGISSLRVYVNGQNVLTWSPKFRPYHLDPENDDSIGYPQTSIFSFGTNIKF